MTETVDHQPYTTPLSVLPPDIDLTRQPDFLQILLRDPNNQEKITLADQRNILRQQTEAKLQQAVQEEKAAILRDLEGSGRGTG